MDEISQENIAKFNQKMVAVMNAIDAVEKRGYNEKQSYGYVKAADVAREVRNVLVENGVSFWYSVLKSERWEKQTASGGVLFFVQLEVEFTFSDMETGVCNKTRGIGWGADTLDKAPYKAMTGALKYGLRMNFLIPDESDPENEGKETEKVVAQEKQVVRKSATSGRDPDDIDAFLNRTAPMEPQEEPLFDEDGNLVESPVNRARVLPSVPGVARRTTPAPSPAAKAPAGRVVTDKMASRFIGKSLTRLKPQLRSLGVEENMIDKKAFEAINNYLGSMGIEKANQILSSRYDEAIAWADGIES